MTDFAIQTRPEAPQVPAQLAMADVLRQVSLVQDVLREVMVEGHHYGVVPGTGPKEGEKARPALFKPGAEKLCMVFRMAPTFAVRTTPLQGGHREERVTCTLTHIPTGQMLATADGSCSTMEAKYRWRNAKPKCPSCGAEAIFRSNQKPGWFCWSKKGGCGEEFGAADQRIRGQKVGQAENGDIADQWNTVLKMACKRALVAATLLATAASDMFMVEEDAEEEPEEPKEKPQPKQQQKTAPAKSEPALTSRQALAHECAKMVAQLDWGPEEVKAAILENGVATAFSKWSDLDEPALERAKKMFEAALKAGKPAEQQP